MLKLDVSNISPRSNREATAGTLFQFIVYRNKKGKTRDDLAQSIFITRVSSSVFQFLVSKTM